MSKTAVITGATSGIGAAFAKRLAADGYDLIITGRRKEIIQKLADELSQKHNVKVKVIIAELSDDTDVQKVIDAIKSGENIEMLINNAGYYSRMQCFNDQDMPECENMVKVLTVVPLRLAYAAIPGMTRRGGGAIINVSSIAGIYPMKKNSIYSPCKAFLKFFSEILYMELKPKGIKVQALCPGFIGTDFYRNSTKEEMELSKGFSFMSPEEVVDCSLSYLKQGRAVCLPGTKYKAMNALFSLLPRAVWYRWVDKAVP